LFLSIYSIALAHPPQDIIINFDSESNMLQAIIVHNVSNPTEHFIKKVDIGLNGEEIIEHKISRQDNNETQIVYYLIPDAKPGDTISVEAYCSISGTLKKEIEVAK
jgi:desulfoferrodoxin (superoxide reductase-like protein)